MPASHAIQLPSDRSFGLTFAVVLGLVGGWLAWRGPGLAPAVAVLGAAAAFLVAALGWPRFLHPLNWLWMRFGLLLNRLVSPIVMGVMFFVLLAPLALLLRWRGRDVLHRKLDLTSPSYWLEREPPGPDGSGFPRQF